MMWRLRGAYWMAVADLKRWAVSRRCEAAALDALTAGESVTSAWLRFGAAWAELGAALLGRGR